MLNELLLEIETVSSSKTSPLLKETLQAQIETTVFFKQNTTKEHLQSMKIVFCHAILQTLLSLSLAAIHYN